LEYIRNFYWDFYVSIVPAVSEKILLLWIGAAFVNTDVSIGATTSITFLRGDGGLPFFTVTYMALSVLSIGICIFVAAYKKSKLTKIVVDK
jgi:hypothetical protein